MGRLVRAAVVCGWLCLAVGARAAAPEESASVRQALSFRSAQADALRRLAERIESAHFAPEATVGDRLERGSDGWISLRLFLRSARPAGEPRYYSDGVTEVDLEMPLETVVEEVKKLLHDTAADLADLRAESVEGYLRATGVGRAPEDVAPAAVARVVATPTDVLPEVYPVGWENIQPAGRIQAARHARIRAYQAMGERIREARVTPALTVAAVVGTAPAAQARLDVFLRSLPLAGPPRMMPDGLCEVTVRAPVRDLIAALKEIRGVAAGGAEVREEELDGLSVRLKTDYLEATGCGAAGAMFRKPSAPSEAPLLPDWAAGYLEAGAMSRPPEQIDDREQARVLALRSAKATALALLAKRLDAVGLDEGRTVRERAAKDPVFQQDVKTFLESAETVVSRETEDGQWEVVVRLPLVRLYEFSRQGM